MAANKPKVLAAAAEEDKVGRKVQVWINTYPDKPVDIIRYEYLPDAVPAMALSTIQGTYITARYITGGHRAEYQFKLIYRIAPGTSNDKRLKADELLNQIGEWAMSQRPDLGDGINAVRVEPTTRSSLFAAYDNGQEDHQIMMKLTYEVNV